MSVWGWLSRMAQAVEKEYDRRVRAASEVTEYGAHHGHAHDTNPAHAASAPAADMPAAEPDEDEGAVVMNVPRGTRLGATSPASGQSDQSSDQSPQPAPEQSSASESDAPAAAQAGQTDAHKQNAPSTAEEQMKS